MTNKQHEALSALLDNEASELDCHRLTGMADDALKAKLNRYALMSQMLQSKTDDKLIDVDICGAISREIRSGNEHDGSETSIADGFVSSIADGSVHDTNKMSRQQAPKSWAWGQIAVAASVMFVLMGTFVLLQPVQETVQDNVAVESILDKQAEAKLLAMTDTPAPDQFEIDYVDERGSVPDMLANTESEIQREKLNEYLLRHAGNGFIGSPQGVAPYARLASFSARTSE